MWHGLGVSLFAAAVLACATAQSTTAPSAPTSTSSPTPTAPAGPTQTAPPSPSPSPTAAPEATPLVTAPPVPADQATWTERDDVAAGPAAREDHTWTVDGDGQTAYLFGGRTSDGPQADLWSFDLATDAWTMVRPEGPAPAARFGHTATWVPDVGLVAWSGQGRDFFSDIWAYDLLTDAWRELPSLGAVPAARYGSCASLGPDGRLWISHGFTQDSGRFSDTRAYDFATGQWTDMTPAGDVPVKRCLHDCYWSADRLILYGGQTTGVAALGDIWAYDLATGKWTRGPDPDALPRQLYALSPLGSSALVFGGGSVDGGFLDDMLAIDSATLEITETGTISDGPAPRSGATLIGDSSQGALRYLLFGGQNETGLLGDLWEFQSYWQSFF